MSYREREHTLVWVDYLIPHVIWCRFIASSKHARSYYQHHSLIVSWLISHFFSWRMSLFSSPPKTIGLSKYRILNISLHSFNHHKQLILIGIDIFICYICIRYNIRSIYSIIVYLPPNGLFISYICIWINMGQINQINVAS